MEDLRLPNVKGKNNYKKVLEEAQSLPKISSKAKLAAKNELYQHEKMIERVGNAKYASVPRNNSELGNVGPSSKKNSSPKREQ